MRKCYATSLAMPKNFVVMDEDAMEYVGGGKPINLPNREDYLSRSICQLTARKLKNQGYCVNMSETEVAKEIHAHAVILYYGAPAAIAAAATGHSIIAYTINDIAKHGVDGIYLDDNPDSAKRVAAYNAVWFLGKA